jgi:hypothetical protein
MGRNHGFVIRHDMGAVSISARGASKQASGLNKGNRVDKRQRGETLAGYFYEEKSRLLD